MKIVNCNPHTIVLRTPAGDLEFPPSGNVARAATFPGQQVEDLDGAPCPIFERPTFGAVEGIPAPLEGTLYLVSLIALEKSGRKDLLAPDTSIGAVRENGLIVAVTRFLTQIQ